MQLLVLSTLFIIQFVYLLQKLILIATKEPNCTDTDDGSVQLIFNRSLFNGEQLNYTLLDA